MKPHPPSSLSRQSTNSPGCVAGVGEGHVPCPQLVELSQGAQTAVNSVPSLHTNHGSYVTIGDCIFNIVSSGDKLKDGWVLSNKLPDDVNLVYECPRCVCVLRRTVHVSRPELYRERRE